MTKNTIKQSSQMVFFVITTGFWGLADQNIFLFLLFGDTFKL